jgi:protein TonB
MRLFLSIILLFVSFVTLNAKKTNTFNPGQHLIVDTVPKTEVDTLVFIKPEIEASVDAAAWKKHLESNLMPYIEKAARKKMPAGQYMVMIRFLVEKDGSISDVMALNDPGYGLANGAVKVLKSGPNWKPGTVNGKTVRSYHTQPITFVIAVE